MAAFSERLERALALASQAHAGQVRKGAETPYISHPVHVAMILLKSGAPEDVVLAGVLHDTLEDTPLQPQAVEAAVGARVLALVQAVTQPEPEAGGRTWRQVKEEALRHLEAASADVVLLKCADTLHNTSALWLDAQAQGVRAFDRFQRHPLDQLWYYGEVARLCVERLGADHPLASELRATVDALRRKVGELIV